MSLLKLQCRFKLQSFAITNLNQVVLNFSRQQVFLHAQHDVLEVQSGDVPGALRILEFEGLEGALLVKVVQKL